MRVRTSQFLVPFALCATGFAALFLIGCGKDEKAPEVPSHLPESYMKDQAFRAKLDESVKSRAELMKARSVVVERMQAMVDAKRAELNTTNDVAVKAALEKDPEWKSLYQRCLDANAALKELGRKTAETVRKRITPQGAGAKKVAVPEKKEISK